MTRDKIFVAAVQTGVLVHLQIVLFSHARQDPEIINGMLVGRNAVDAASVVAEAAQHGEDDIPSNVVAAVREYLAWKIHGKDRPSWARS